jgi:hypothetical protein
MTVSVASGGNAENSLEIAGLTITQVRKQFGEALAISPTQKPTVGGKAVSETYTLRDGDALVFVKNTAEKGDITIFVI